MILIYMNTGEWGGVDVLVGRFAKYLRQKGRDFIIVDKESSRLRSDLPWANFLTPDQANISNLKITKVFLPSVAKLRENDIPWISTKNANVFSWIVHPNDALYQFVPYIVKPIVRWGYGIIPYVLPILLSHRRRVTNMLSIMAAHDALAAMDGATMRSFRYFYPDATHPCAIIPLPVPLSNLVQDKLGYDEILSVGYLGRMDSFKFSALGPFIRNQLSKIAKSRKVTLVAIAVGTHIQQLRDVCSDSGIDLQLHGFMANDEARLKIARDTHFAVAMGTAALDIAASGHPCIYIDPAERNGYPSQSRFRFVHETQEYVVGEFRDFPGYVGGVHSIEETVDQVMTDPLIGQRGRAYVREHHDPDRVNASILRHLDTSTLTMGELEPLVMAVKDSNTRDLARVALLRRVGRMVDPKRWKRSLTT